MQDEEKDEEEEEEEREEAVSEFNTLFNRLMKSARTHAGAPSRKAGRPQEAEPVREEEELLEEGLVRARTMEDLESLVHDGAAEETAVSVSHPAGTDTASAPRSKEKRKEIDPSEVLTKDANVIKVPLAPTLLEGDDGEEEEVSPGTKARLLLQPFPALRPGFFPLKKNERASR